MKIGDCESRSVLLWGFGQEGQSTLRYLRAAFPEKTLGVADQLPLEQMGQEAAALLRGDPHLQLHLGERYLRSLCDYAVIVKSPGISVTLPAYEEAVAAGKRITSHTALFFANCPGRVIGITGTKGKSTTASLIASILQRTFPDTHLVGNIGVPALDRLVGSSPQTLCFY